jgi:phospholipid/cholesterol/gamma-HCH transport system substrate-binding protein
MKISNETKVGALTAIAIVVLILGFNYLKGRNLTQRDDEIYAVFPSVGGVAVSNAVYINGLQVGKVTDLRETDKNLSGVIVSINLTKDINIPTNSVVSINSELLSSTSLAIHLGDARSYIDDGDTLRTVLTASVMGELTKNINPAIDKVTQTLASLDMLIKKVSTLIDPNTQNNIQGIIANLNSSSRSLERLINAQNSVLAKSLNNVESITGNLAAKNDKIGSTIDNLEKTTSHLAEADIEKTLQSIRNTMSRLEETVARINSKDGSLGLLLNDRQLYDEIRQTNRSLTTLLDDVRVHPKRYVNISVFGRKAREPLMAPLYDTTINR